MASKLLLVIIPAVIAGIFGLAATMIDTNQGGEGGDTISVVDSEDTTIITGDENQVIINQYSEELQQLKQNQLLILEALGIEPQIDQTQNKEISQETLQTIEEQRKEIDRLSQELEIAGQEQTVDIDLLLRESSAYFYSGDKEKSLALAEMVLKVDPNNVEALTNKAIVLGNMDNHQEAILLLDKVLDVDSTNVRALALQGSLYMYMEKYEDASILFGKALEIDQKDISLWDAKIAALYNLGKKEEVILWVDKALQVFPNHPNFLSIKDELQKIP